MSGTRLIPALLLAVLLTSAARAQDAQPAAADAEAKLIAVLASDAQLEAKAEACRELAHLGTGTAVAALAACLADEKLGHMARFALEPIPDPAVDVELRKALGTLQGRPLVGVIVSVGVRRDAAATEALAKRLQDADAEVVQAAARSLGRIGTPAAAAALEGVLPNVPAASRLGVIDGVLGCAEVLAAGGARDRAAALCDRVRALPDLPHQVRTGALRGAVLSRGDAGVPLLMEAWRGSDFALTEGAARIALELPGPAVGQALIAELPKLTPDKQILAASVLGRRGHTAAVPALSALAKAGEAPARVAAIRALSELGGDLVPLFLALQNDPVEEVAQAAREAFATLSGPAVDAAVVAMLADPDPKTRGLAIDLVNQRRVLSAMPALLTCAAAGDEGVRVKSIKAVGDLGGPAELKALIGMLLKGDAGPVNQALETALSAICVREARPNPAKVVIRQALYGVLKEGGTTADVTAKVADMVKNGTFKIEATNASFGDPTPGQVKEMRLEYAVDGVADTKTVGEGGEVTISANAAPPALVEALSAALGQAAPDPKCALLRVLRAARGPQALAAVRAATADADATVKAEAVATLCAWPSTDALPDILPLAKAAPDARTKILALRGALRLIPLQEAKPGARLAALQEVAALVERPEEKRLALASLASIGTADALAAVLPYLADAAVKEDACQAAVTVATAVAKTQPEPAAAAMAEVLKVAANQATIDRAKAVQAKAAKAAAPAK